MSEQMRIVLIIGIAIVVLFLAWYSMMMAAVESAIARVTRANLNNLMIEVQTDSELSAFNRTRKIRRIHTMQRLVVNRYASSNSCAFFRIASNVIIGTLIACIAALCEQPIWVQLVAGLVAALIMAILAVVMRPRTAGTNQPVEILLRHSTLAAVAVRLTPFIRRHHNARNQQHSMLELSDDEELEKIQLEQGKAAIDRLVEMNRFDPEVSEMLRNVLMLSDTLTREIMVPRTDMICIEQDDTLESFLRLCSRSGFSRVPVIGENIDDLLGVAYLKDAVRATAFNAQAKDRSITSIMRSPMYVPESKPADDLFHDMQHTRNHVAIVCDEYGGIAGMVTIEDAIEQIVGELDDEHDHSQHAEPKQIGNDEWSMPARTPITDLEEIFEIDLDEHDVDTVFGLLTKLLGKVPIVGSSAVTHGLRLTAVDSAGRRKKVSTIVVQPASQSDQEDNADDTSAPNESDELKDEEHDNN